MSQVFYENLTAVVHNFLAGVTRVHETEAKTWENGEKIMNLAKKLAKADMQNPDVITLGFVNMPLAAAAKGTVEIGAPIHPAWWHYVLEARAAIEFLTFLDKHELLDEEPVASSADSAMAAVRDIAGKR